MADNRILVQSGVYGQLLASGLLTKEEIVAGYREVFPGESGYTYEEMQAAGIGPFYQPEPGGGVSAATLPAVVGAAAGAWSLAGTISEFFGGNNMTMTQLGAGAVVDGVPISGPGVPEPPAQLVAKQWVIMVNSKAYGAFYMYYFRLLDGRIMSYHPYKGWKIWRPKKPLAVMYRGKTTLSQAVKVQRYLDSLWKSVAKKTKQLKMAK